jgi:RimJ/RimL family protein N-acetyltransferase
MKLLARQPLEARADLRVLERELAFERDHGIQYWPIFERSTGRHAGCCGLKPFDGLVEVGFHLRPPFWGAGYATEAARAAVAHAFDRLDVPLLGAGHHPANDGSRRVLTKLGFTYAREQPYEPTGLIHPFYLLPRETWRSRPAAAR